MAHVPITAPHGLQTRHNIDDFATNPILTIRWSLFVRALTAMKAPGPNIAVNVNNPLSYLSLAGIHKWPHRMWPTIAVDPNMNNYCAHHRSTFLTWHRVYVLLFEKAIIAKAVELAGRAPLALRDDHVHEALKIRLPFWDWGHTMALPLIMQQLELNIIIPEQNPLGAVAIANPLLSYVFEEALHPAFPVQQTTRFAVNDIAFRLQGVRALVFDSIQDNDTYGGFSNQGNGIGNSVEQPHDIVHDSVGLHMSQNRVAAFDPIFWLHHSTIDRYYAMWQVLNPDAGFEINDLQPNDHVTAGLAPFQTQDPDTLWTSAMVHREPVADIPILTFDLGYDYPETLAAFAPLVRVETVGIAIVALYGPPPAPPPLSPPGDGPDAGGAAQGIGEAILHPVAIAVIPTIHGDPPAAQFPPPGGGPDGAGGDALLFGVGLLPHGALPIIPGPDVPLGLPEGTGFRREWKLWIQVKLNFNPLNFNIYCLLGNKGVIFDDPAYDWSSGPDVAGRFYVSKSSTATCASCRDAEDSFIYGGIILTAALLARLPEEIKLGDVVAVEDWLLKNLYWKIKTADGTEVPLKEEGTEGGKYRLLIGLESFEKAYAPINQDGSPACKPSDLPKIRGVTWDKKDHTRVTATMASSGGATKKRAEYSSRTTATSPPVVPV